MLFTWVIVFGIVSIVLAFFGLVFKTRGNCLHCNGEGDIPPASMRDDVSSHIKCPYCDGTGYSSM